MTSRSQVVLAALVATLLLPRLGTAQQHLNPSPNEGPSLAETLEWLQNYLPTLGTYAYNQVFTNNDASNRYRSEDIESVMMRDVRVANCTLSFRQVTVDLGKGVLSATDGSVMSTSPHNDSSAMVYSIPLAEADPLSSVVKPSPPLDTSMEWDRPLWAIVLEATGGQKAFSWQMWNTDQNAWKVVNDAKSQEAVLNFGDHDAASRVARALKHAIRLCGGRAAPF